MPTPEELRLWEAVELEFRNVLVTIESAPVPVAYRSITRFIYTFRRYTTAKRLFDLTLATLNRVLKRAFKDQDKFEKNAASLLTFADVWLRTLIDTECLERSNRFASIISRLSRTKSEAVSEKASRVMCSLVAALVHRSRLGSASDDDEGEDYRIATLAPLTTRPSLSDYTKMSTHETGHLWAHKHETIASLFAVVEWRHFAAIPFADFQNKAWSDPEKFPNRAIVLREFIERSNRISDWVATGILAQRTSKSKASILQAYVLLAKHCYEAGNYNVASSILLGIQSNEVDRIKKQLDIEAKYITLFMFLDSKLTQLSNYAPYRATLADRIASGKPFVPIMAVLLRDLTFIEDANPNTTENAGIQINVGKMDQLQDSYEIINRARVRPYKATKLDPGHAYALMVLEKLPRLSQPERQTLSERFKPRVSAVASDAHDENHHSGRSSPASSRSTSVSAANPADSPLFMEDSSGSSRNDLVDMPLDLSSMSDKSFLGLHGSSARTSVTGLSDLRQDV